MEPTAVSRAILGGLIADDTRSDEVVASVTAWIGAHADRVGRHTVAWTAAKSVELGLDAIDAGAAAVPTAAQLRVFRTLPVGSRVVVALHEFCGLDDDEVARVTARPIAEVKGLLDTVGHGVAPEPATLLEPEPEPEPEPDPVLEPVGGPPAPPPAVTPPPTIAAPSRSARRKAAAGPRSSRTRWWIVAAVVVLALVAAGIAANNLRDDAPATTAGAASGLGDAASVSREQLSAGCATPAGDAAVTPGTVDTTIDGTARSYRVIAASPVAAGRPRPLVIAFGDVGQSVEQQVAESRLDDLAAALKLVVVTVAASGDPAQWNVTGSSDGPDDAALVEQIIRDQAARLCIDQTRVLLAGRGAGAHVAAAFACSHPGEVSGLILVAGVYRTSSCTTAGPFSLLAVLGADDDTYPMSGGNSPSFEEAFGDRLGDGAAYEPVAPPATLDAWADELGCVSNASQQIGLATARIDTTCDDDGEVWRVVIPGAGHEWYPATYDLMVQFLTTGPFRTT